jgi:hippurate hydrolase
MNATRANASDPVLGNLDLLLPDLEALYTDVHMYSELSM